MSVTVWVQSVLVCETFVELLEETRVTRPALRFQYYILPSVTKNLLALGIFKVHCQEGWENWWKDGKINKIISAFSVHTSEVLAASLTYFQL